MAANDYVTEATGQALATAINTSLGNIRARVDALGTAEHTVADFAALLVYDDGLAAADKLNIGDMVDVADASGDPSLTSGWGVYRVIVTPPSQASDFRLAAAQEFQGAALPASTVDLSALITN